jgi:hypothetical protein
MSTLRPVPLEYLYHASLYARAPNSSSWSAMGQCRWRSMASLHRSRYIKTDEWKEVAQQDGDGYKD